MLTRRRILIGGGATSLVVIGLLVFGFWWFLIRDNSPAAVSLTDAVSSLDDGTPAPSVEDGETTPASEPSSTAATSLSLNGTWTVASQGETFVGYRVQEEVVRIGTRTAVGRSPTVDATITIVDMELTGTTVVANLRDLRSDESIRDRQLTRQAIETDTFPTATFELTETVAIPESFGDWEAISFLARGTLTLHGVTQAVEIPLEAEIVGGDVMVVVGSILILFSDYDVQPPRSQSLLSIEDNGVMELQLFLEKTG